MHNLGIERREPRGFTLIELLVVIGIIGILASIVIPAIRTAQDKARVAGCLSNLRGLGPILQGYAQDHRGFFPFDVPLEELDPSAGTEVADTEAALSRLFQEGYLDNPKVLICPGSVNVPQERDGKWEEFELEARHSSYAYRRFLTRADREESTTPLLADKKAGGAQGHHHNALCVLYLDGSAEALPLKDLKDPDELAEQFEPALDIDD